MRLLNICILMMVLAFVIGGCRNREEKNRQKSTELITARTLGLAYLEENKLEEAEKEFLRFIDLAPKEKLGYANLGLVYLRMGKYDEAEKILKKAIRIDPKDPDVRLILAQVYEMDNRKDLSISTLKESLKFAPDHVKSLYTLSELVSNMPDSVSVNYRKDCLRKVIMNVPDNIVPRLDLIEIYIRHGNTDPALEQMEDIARIFPEFPREAIEYYNTAVRFLQAGKTAEAVTPFIIFSNYLKVTPPYQAGITDLKGPGGSLIGFPVITFDQQLNTGTTETGSILNAMKFTDVTLSAGLNLPVSTGINAGAAAGLTNVAESDFDGDGDIDIYVGNYDPGASEYKHYLFRSDMGKFTDVAGESGLRHSGAEYFAKFDDYDNDGFFDLFVLTDGKNILYRNTGKGSFTDVSDRTNVGEDIRGNKSLFFDADHDGDLDLYVVRPGVNYLYRNNANESFTEQAAAMNLAGSDVNSRDAAFGDFDEDGDLDLFVVNENAGNILFSNQRQGIFKDISDSSGLDRYLNSGAVAVGDYNNDGFLDLFITSLKGGNHRLYLNSGHGKFTKDARSDEIFAPLRNVTGFDATFLDIDNDGSLDLLVAGESTEKEGRGVFLFHNNGKDNFDDVSGLLPEDLKSGRQIVTFDYNSDGDMDVVIAGVNGGIKLLRNDGGNMNHFVKITLKGLRTGSAKNNYYGIGAKVEVRSGDLYQSKVVTDPNMIFGLGTRQKSDVIRITWTNGVPQNIFFPGTDQSIIEAQVLKGSCPFLYAWNGARYEFVKDILWRSALGMPLGIMGETHTYGFANASDDYIGIQADQLMLKEGRYSIMVTAELWETIYLDKLRLIAVDHPDSVDVYADEKFSPPPFPEYRVFPVVEKHFPVSATDGRGNDLLPYIVRKDDKYISNFMPGKYQGITQISDLILDPGTIGSDKNLYLFMNGWVFPTDASINAALSQNENLEVLSPVLQVINKKGEWETVINNLGFPMGKDKTMVINLDGIFPSGDTRIRIRTNMQIYWDQIFFASCDFKVPVRSSEMTAEKADLHYRGFSKSFRKGGRYGPHWFNYAKCTEESRWRDLTGNYTRYGDVLFLLSKADDMYVIMNSGDEIAVDFSAGELPELKKGWTRDFMIRNVGWVKDGDLNTATGNRVEPLPFNGMSRYPYDGSEAYPADAAHKEYLRKYNTRKVSTRAFTNALKN